MKKGTFSSKGWEKLSIKSGINPKMAQRIQYQERVIEYGPSQQEEIKFTLVLSDSQQRNLRKNDPLAFWQGIVMKILRKISFLRHYTKVQTHYLS